MQPYKQIINQKFVIVIFQYFDKSIDNDRKIMQLKKEIGQPYLVISWKQNFIVIFQEKLLASALEQLEKNVSWSL